MAGMKVAVVIIYGGDQYMKTATENLIKPENVPAAARLLMDTLYLRLDDQVSAAKLRAHRRRLRDNHRERAVGQVETLAPEKGERETAGRRAGKRPTSTTSEEEGRRGT